MLVVGYILVIMGALVCLAGEWRFLVITYRHGLAWFFGSLFIPFVSLAFLCLHLKESWRPFVVSQVGLAVTGFGGWMAGAFSIAQ